MAIEGVLNGVRSQTSCGGVGQQGVLQGITLVYRYQLIKRVAYLFKKIKLYIESNKQLYEFKEVFVFLEFT